MSFEDWMIERPSCCAWAGKGVETRRKKKLIQAAAKQSHSRGPEPIDNVSSKRVYLISNHERQSFLERIRAVLLVW